MRSLDAALLYVDIPITGAISALLEKDAVARMHRDNAEAAFEPARAALRRARLSFREIVRSGNVVDAIDRTARRGGFDLIVVGSRGRSPLTDWLSGSTTRELLATSKVPVMVVP